MVVAIYQYRPCGAELTYSVILLCNVPLSLRSLCIVLVAFFSAAVPPSVAFRGGKNPHRTKDVSITSNRPFAGPQDSNAFCSFTSVQEEIRQVLFVGTLDTLHSTDPVYLPPPTSLTKKTKRYQVPIDETFTNDFPKRRQKYSKTRLRRR